jgi:hypothetical protein
VDRSKNFKALRADLQGLCPILKPKAIFKGFARSTGRKSDLQTK